MRYCCECNKIVWPWQQSEISFSPIHLQCHRLLIKKTVTEQPELRELVKHELHGSLNNIWN